jgi:RHS repeat-associated protein
MSKAGNSYYYLQDELGSPMYMTGTDGAAVSSYAFDDFGRGIDPFTGGLKEAGKKHTKHGYTTEGNIIQPFAFTGYQEDEVSGLMFAQARHYDATSGRFQSEDLVKGFTSIPFTLNHYSYCFGNPVGFVDRNGKLFDWAADAWDKACDIAGDVKDTVSDAVDKACDTASDFWEENKDTIIKVGATAAVAGALVAGAVVAPGAVGFVCASALAGGTISMAVDVGAQVIENKGFSNFNLDQTLIAGASGALSGALSCVTANPGLLFAGNAAINSAAYAGTQAAKGEEISPTALVINGLIGGFVGAIAGSNKEAMEFAERDWGWRYFGEYITKSDWAKECLDWIGEYVTSGLAKSTAYEIGRYTTTYYSTTGTAIDLIDSTVDAVIDYICGD